MALHSLNSEAYGADPWFSGGSQDDWSIFSPLYARLVSASGLEQGAMFMTLASGLLFVLAAGALSRALIRGRAHWLAMMCLVSVPLCYSASDMFYVREGFATARGLAVPLSLLGVAWSVRGLRAASLTVLALALAIHPIMALGPAAVSVLLSVARPVQRVLLLIGAAVLAGIFVAGEQGFLRMLDGQWLYFVRHSPLIFIESWVEANLSGLAAWFALLLFGSRYGQWRVRHVYGLAAVVAAIGLTASILAGQIPVLIVLQAQLWRCMWFVQVLGVVAVVDLAARYLIRSRAPRRDQVILVLLLILVLRDYVGWLLLAGFVFLSAGGGFYLSSLAQQFAVRKRWIWCINATLALMLLPGYWASLSLVFASAESKGEAYDMAKGLMLSGGFGLLPFLCWWAMSRWRAEAYILVLSAAAAIAALLHWDSRTADLRYQEARYVAGGTGRLFDAWIRPGDVVYWHQNPERTWFELGTAGYASATHCSGQVFSEQRISLLESRLGRVVTASLDEARLGQAQRGEWRLTEALRSGDTSVQSVAADALVSYDRVAPAGAAGIRHICGDSSLKYLIASRRLDGAFLAQDVETFGGRTPVAYYLYSCDSLRKTGIKDAAS